MNITRNDGRVEVKLDGDLVASATEQLREALKTVVAEGVSELTMDMGKAEVIDSLGVGLVISLHNSVAKAGGTISLVNVSQDIIDLFKNMRLDRHFAVSGA